MTVAAFPSYTYYWGDGVQTAFAYPFEVERPEDFVAYLDDLQVTNYTLTGLGNETGGLCTFTVAPSLGMSLVLMRRLPLDQETMYPAYSPFPAAAHEKTLDRLCMQVQQLEEELERASRLKRTIRPPWRNLVLPDPLPNTILGWDAAGAQWTLYPAGMTQIQVDPISGIGWGKNTIALQPAAGSAQASGLLFPPGVLVVAVTAYVQTTVGQTQGVQQMSLGAPELPDCWGVFPAFTAETVTSAGNLLGYSGQPVPGNGQVTLTAYGGLFDGTGLVYVTGHFMTFSAATQTGFYFQPGTPDAGTPLPMLPASETQAGITQYATPSLTIEGLRNDLATHPAGVKAAIDAAKEAGSVTTGTGTWSWTTATAGAPNAGKVGVNHATLSLVTEIRIAVMTTHQADFTVLLTTLQAGDIVYMQDKNDSTRRGRYQLTAPGTLQDPTWMTLPVTVIGVGTNPFANNQDVGVSFTVGAMTVPAGTPLSVPRYTASGATLETTPGLLTTSDGRLGVGGVAPEAGYTLQVTGPLLVRNSFLGLVQENNQQSVIQTLYSSTLAHTNTYQGQRAAGTEALPQASPNGQVFLRLTGKGHDGSTFPAAARTWIDLVGTELWSPTTQGSAITFNTTLSGTVTQGERLRIDGLGNLTTTGGAVTTGMARGLALTSGTAPTSSPADAIQLWAADRAGTAGKGSLHVRTEDGTSHVFGDQVGIGTVTPDAGYQLHVQGALLARNSFVALFKDSGNNSIFLNTYSTTGSHLAILQSQRAGGTEAAQAATAAGQVLLRINAKGSDGGGFPPVAQTWIDFIGTDAQTASTRGSALTFNTTLSGTATQAERMRIHGNGYVGIGTATPTFPLHVTGRVGLGVPNTAPTDADLGNNQMSVWVNGTNLTFRVKDNAGTMRTGTLALT